MKHDLRDAIAIAEMYKEHSTEVAAAMHPSHEQGGGPHVRGSQLAAGMRAAQFAQEI
jgi:hypothetical protein